MDREHLTLDAGPGIKTLTHAIIPIDWKPGDKTEDCVTPVGESICRCGRFSLSWRDVEV